MYKIKGGGWTTHPIQFYKETRVALFCEKLIWTHCSCIAYIKSLWTL